ncbi:hypothetical protein PVAND_008396 [Polypedilum vanderplanki]|uniref:E3 ubiquitin-protein ligase APD1-4 middle domain-containing protein n=1 Tax=Polypedilum vanderplanki TaxID=319348 RepID=A0A9J6C9V2_POLVA|nr:hypothetical protein PVAND_008396 [Polypedilum vanderplanki]
MHGVKRVLAFCCLVAIVPTILIILPLYLKHEVFKDMVYSVAESDILEVRQGISTIFCQEHLLKMNTSFSAFQLHHMPEESKTRKHIRLKKSMILPDDTLEYWGFYLMSGATVELKVCSRYEGSRLLVVKGERNLRTCGLLEHNMNKFGAAYNSEKSQVKVTFETAAEIVEPDIITREENVRYNSDEIIPSDDESQFDNGGEVFDDDEVQKKRQDISKNYLKRDKNSIDEDKANDDLDNSAPAENHEKSNILERDSENDNKLNEEDKTEQPKSQNIKRERQNNADDTQRLKRSHKHHHKNKKQRHEQMNAREKRDTILDRGGIHGGNAPHYKPRNESESISSFENSLLECFDGNILVAKYFPPSKNCNSVKYLEQGAHLVSKHEVSTDGYYYYIFYSDNDDAFNHIHAVFDIWKPSYLYANLSESKNCINSTTCNFKVQMFSDEIVIVEVPTRDGIEHEEDDVSLLVSQCVPRMSVYIVFPILVLVFILGCAFI